MKIFHSTQQSERLLEIEVETLAKIKHPRIVNMVEHGYGLENDGKPFQYILLELAENGSLFDYIAHSGRFTEPVARAIFKQMLEGLGYLHAAGFTHRDLKPENLLFDANFDIKITDFGFADINNQLLHTQLGTDGYMAPEITLGEAYSGQSVDLFAAAIILFTMITGRRPFNRAHPQDPHYVALITNPDKFWNLHAKEDGANLYSDEFKDLFVKLMSFTPNLRPELDDVLCHPWMMGFVPTKCEILDEFQHRTVIVNGTKNMLRLK